MIRNPVDNHPTEEILAELRRLHSEASEIARSHDEYLRLMFMATAEILQRATLAADPGHD